MRPSRIPGQGPTLEDFGELKQPSEALEPILPKEVRLSLSAWLEEIWSVEELVAVDLKPRRKALFDGPPGVGKTTLAHHLAARLGLPMLVVFADRIIDSWIGSSSRNIGTLFDLLADENVLVVLDEFDSIGGKRSSNPTQGADRERNHTVNTFLNRFEAYEGYCIAATNHGKDLDGAVWRRFDIHIDLKLPQQGERVRILKRYLAPFQLPKAALELLATHMETATPALIRSFCEGLKRNIVVGPKVGWDMDRASVLGRVLGTVQPHPDAGKPALWSHGPKCLDRLPWPLSKDAPQEEPEAVAPAEASSATVVQLRKP